MYPIPGRSFARPPLTKTRLYLEQSNPEPGSRAVTNRPVVSLTLATLRVAELGFLGFLVRTIETVPLI